MLSGGFHLKVMIQFITMLQVMPSYKAIVKDVFAIVNRKMSAF